MTTRSTKSLLTLTLLVLGLPALCVAQPDVSLNYDPENGEFTVSAIGDPPDDFSVGAFLWESPVDPLTINDGFFDGRAWSSSSFGDLIQLSVSPGLESPQHCFVLATYPTGLTLDDFGEFELGITMSFGSPGTTIFGTVGLKTVPEPDALLLLGSLIPLALLACRRR